MISFEKVLTLRAIFAYPCPNLTISTASSSWAMTPTWSSSPRPSQTQPFGWSRWFICDGDCDCWLTNDWSDIFNVLNGFLVEVTESSTLIGKHAAEVDDHDDECEGKEENGEKDSKNDLKVFTYLQIFKYNCLLFQALNLKMYWNEKCPWNIVSFDWNTYFTSQRKIKIQPNLVFLNFFNFGC